MIFFKGHVRIRALFQTCCLVVPWLLVYVCLQDNFPTLNTIASDLSPFYLAKARDNVNYWKSQRAARLNLGGPEGTGASNRLSYLLSAFKAHMLFGKGLGFCIGLDHTCQCRDTVSQGIFIPLQAKRQDVQQSRAAMSLQGPLISRQPWRTCRCRMPAWML